MPFRQQNDFEGSTCNRINPKPGMGVNKLPIKAGPFCHRIGKKITEKTQRPPEPLLRDLPAFSSGPCFPRYEPSQRHSPSNGSYRV